MRTTSRSRMWGTGATWALAGFVLAGVICAPSGAFAARGPGKVKTCAVIAGPTLDPDASELLSLLEGRLAKRGDLRLVDRTEIERVLRERELKLMFSPPGGSERRTLGKILKADLLVSLHMGQAEGTRYVDVIICETAGGVRLLTRSVAASGKPDQDAETIEELIAQALRKYDEEILEVCAVPPFLSRDLTRRYDHLQTAYARLIEQLLLNQTGILVVELAEAQAVARELVLSGQGEGPVRKLPLYVVGEYRHSGLGDEMKVAVTLSLKRGEQVLATATKPDLPPDQVSGFVQQSAQELLAGATGQRLRPMDRALEAKLLAERAHLFRRIGNWAEALSLFEASLLLEPDQPRTHQQACVVIAQLTQAHYDIYGGYENFTRKAIVGLNLYRSGMMHLEFFLRAAAFDRYQDMNFVSEYFGAPGFISGYAYYHPDTSKEVNALLGEIAREKRQMLLRVMEARARAGDLDDRIAGFLGGYFYPRVDDELERSSRLRAIRLIQDLPKARQWTAAFASHGDWVNWKQQMEPWYQAFLDEIEKIPNENVRAGVRDLRVKINQEYEERMAKEKTHAKPVPPVPEPKPPGPYVVLHPLNLTAIRGCLSCGPGTDVFWGLRGVYLMKQKGQLKPVYATEETDVYVGPPVYDGRYVWVPLVRRRSPGPDKPRALVFDPTTEQVWTFTGDDGLPVAVIQALAAPVAPGCICMAGSFDRAWCALLKVAPDGTKSVDVFHEARLHRDRLRDRGREIRNDAVAFIPDFMLTLSDPKDPSNKRILLGRSIEDVSSSFPLLIDPKTRTVKVLMEGMGGAWTHQGTAWWLGTGLAVWKKHDSVKVTLARLGFPDFKPETVFEGVVLEPEYRMLKPVFYRGQLHLVGWHWWTADDLSGRFRRLPVEAPKSAPIAGHVGDIPGQPHLRAFFTSSHYGLIVRAEGAIYQVEFR